MSASRPNTGLPKSTGYGPRTTDRGSRPKIAVYWTGGCGGCDVSFLELGPALLDVLAQVEIAFWPALVDTKRSEVEAFPPRSIAATLVNGTLRTEENVEMVHLLREKSQLVVAFGACAYQGGVPGLANLSPRDQLLRRVARNGFRPAPPPGGEAEDAPPELLPEAKALADEIAVDYVVPGCPPMPSLIGPFFAALLSGDLPHPGHVFAHDKALCEECPRTREERRLTKVVRPHEALPDPEVCLLDQGMICLGPVTRGGCGAACPKAGMPCTGCVGPTPNAGDPGLAMISALGSLARAGEEGPGAFAAEDKLLDALVDPLGTFYKYSLPTYVRRKGGNG